MGIKRLTPVFLVLFLYGCATTPYSVPLSQKAKAQSSGKGIPYYLPHPYLVITKNLTCVPAPKPESTGDQNTDQGVTKNNPGKIDAVLTADAYAMQVIYLPDPDQKYALYFNKGTGSYESAISLVDGWKLAGLNMKGDAKTAETIQAVGSVIKEAGSAAATFRASAFGQKKVAKAGPEASEVGIWVYDLMGGMPFPCVFTWSSPEKGN